jgi:exportin-5
VLEEPLHIKESLARLVVEIIKREWPQKWKTLLQDLTTICNMGVRIREKRILDLKKYLS